MGVINVREDHGMRIVRLFSGQHHWNSWNIQLDVPETQRDEMWHTCEHCDAWERYEAVHVDRGVDTGKRRFVWVPGRRLDLDAVG